jgi:hypothetical protein
MHRVVEFRHAPVLLRTRSLRDKHTKLSRRFKLGENGFGRWRFPLIWTPPLDLRHR